MTYLCTSSVSYTSRSCRESQASSFFSFARLNARRTVASETISPSPSSSRAASSWRIASMWTYRVFPSRIARTAVPTMSRFELELLLL